jgi:hypothetical protein
MVNNLLAAQYSINSGGCQIFQIYCARGPGVRKLAEEGGKQPTSRAKDCRLGFAAAGDIGRRMAGAENSSGTGRSTLSF